MIGLDTNVLVRWITQDDEVQCARIKNLFNQYKLQAEVFYINEIVLCEMLWVLQSVFSYPKSDLILYEKHSVGFADCLISVKNASVKCNTTFSFDKAATQLPYVTKL